MKKKGFNKFFTCPNCLGVYELIPVTEIATLCKRCKFKRPKKRLCRSGIDQYTKRVTCRWWKYNGGGRKKKGSKWTYERRNK